MEKQEYIAIAKDYELRAYFEGLKTDEIPIIKELITKIKIKYAEEIHREELIDKCYNFLKRLLDDLYMINSFNNFNTIDREYTFVENNSLISHLVFANNERNKIRPKANIGSIFKCQFDSLNKSSMLVTPINNHYFCYNCDAKGNAIDYIVAKEKLSVEKAMNLLARIYLLNYPKQNYNVDRMTLAYYQDSLLSEEYLNFVLTQERIYFENEEKYSFMERVMMELTFEKILETIERVRKKEYKDFKVNESKKLNLVYEYSKDTTIESL